MECCPVRTFKSHVTYRTFSSSSVMLSREIFLKTTSFPSLRLYKSTVLKRRKNCYYVTSFILQSEVYAVCVTILHSVPPSLSAFSLFLREPDQNFVCFSIPFLFYFILCSVYSAFTVPTGILWLPWLRSFRAFSSVVRQMPGYNLQRLGTVRTLPN